MKEVRETKGVMRVVGGSKRRKRGQRWIERDRRCPAEIRSESI